MADEPKPPPTDDQLAELKAKLLALATEPESSNVSAQLALRLLYEVQRRRAAQAAVDVTTHSDGRRRLLCTLCGQVREGAVIAAPDLSKETRRMAAVMPPLTEKELDEIEEGDQPGRIPGTVTVDVRFAPDEPDQLTDEELGYLLVRIDRDALPTLLRLVAEVRRLRETVYGLELTVIEDRGTSADVDAFLRKHGKLPSGS